MDCLKGFQATVGELDTALMRCICAPVSVAHCPRGQISSLGQTKERDGRVKRTMSMYLPVFAMAIYSPSWEKLSAVIECLRDGSNIIRESRSLSSDTSEVKGRTRRL